MGLFKVSSLHHNTVHIYFIIYVHKLWYTWLKIYIQMVARCKTNALENQQIWAYIPKQAIKYHLVDCIC